MEIGENKKREMGRKKKMGRREKKQIKIKRYCKWFNFVYAEMI